MFWVASFSLANLLLCWNNCFGSFLTGALFLFVVWFRYSIVCCFWISFCVLFQSSKLSSISLTYSILLCRRSALFIKLFFSLSIRVFAFVTIFCSYHSMITINVEFVRVEISSVTCDLLLCSQFHLQFDYLGLAKSISC